MKIPRFSNPRFQLTSGGVDIVEDEWDMEDACFVQVSAALFAFAPHVPPASRHRIVNLLNAALWLQTPLDEASREGVTP